MRKRLRKTVALTLSATTLATSVVTTIPSEIIYAQEENESVVISSIAGLHLTLKYAGKTENLVIAEDGKIKAEGLFEHIKSLGWTETGYGSELVQVTYELNYPGKTVKEREAAGGNIKYQGIAGTFDISADGIVAPKYTETIAIKTPEEEKAVCGYIYITPFGDMTSKKPYSEKLTITGGEAPEEITPTANGFFISSNKTKDDGKEYTLSVNATDTHTGLSVASSEDISALYVIERFIPTNDMYELSPAYVKKGEEKTVEVKGVGHTLSKTLDGAFSSSISILVKADGTSETFYVKDKEGNISSPVINAVKIDETAPVVTSVETSSENASFKDHGIYANKAIPLTLKVKITETDSGIKNIVLKSKSGKEYNHSGEITLQDGVYTAIFNIASQTEMLKETLSLIATDNVGNTSEEMLIKGKEESSTITIENKAPDVSDITAVGKMSLFGWYKSVPQISVKASDKDSGLARVVIKANDIEVTAKDYENKELEEQTFDINLTNEIINKNKGRVKITVTVSDNCGNFATKELKVKIDTSAPLLSISGMINGEITNDPKNVVIRNMDFFAPFSSDSIIATIIRDGSELETIKSESSETELIIPLSKFAEEGQYQVKANTTDLAGNVAKEVTLSFMVDKTKPELSLKEISKDPSKYNWFNSGITLTFNHSDALSGEKTITASINGKDVPIQEGSATVTNELISNLAPEDGVYSVIVTSTDKAGNIATFEQQVKIDNIAPNIELLNIEEGKNYISAPSLTVKSDDKFYSEEGHRIISEVYRDNVLVKTLEEKGVQSTTFHEFKEDGKYEVKSKAIDAAGNISSEKNVTFIVDATDPIITYKGIDVAPNTNGWINKAFTFSYRAEDETSGIDSVKAKINGSDVPTEEGKVLVSTDLIESLINDTGTYTVEIEATDKAGNVKTFAQTFKVDLVAPNLSFSGIEKDTFYKSASLTVSNDEKHFAESGAAITIQIELDGTTISNKTYMGTNKVDITSFAADGKYRVIANAVDAAGNEGAAKEITFIKDSTAPVITLSGIEEGKYYNTPVGPIITVDERFYETNTVTVSLIREYGGTTVEIPYPFTSNGKVSVANTVFSEVGKYTLTVNAVDKAGNAASSKQVSWFVDTKAPILTVEGVENGGVYTYDSVVAPVIKYDDDYFENVSMSLNRAGLDWLGKVQVVKTEKGYIFSNFPKEKLNDGRYVLSVSVSDKAGNVSKQEIVFTVNRFGSFFTYPESLVKLNGSYLQTLNEDLYISEFNVSLLKNTEFVLKRDGKTVSIKGVNKDSGESNGYNVTNHIFAKDAFKEEGVYELNVISEDSAGNKMESKAENGEVKIYIDRTAPIISTKDFDISIIHAENHRVNISVKDNLSPFDVTATINGKEVKVEEENDNLYIIVPEGDKQNITIKAKDKAGNESEITGTLAVIPNGLVYFVTKFKAAVITGLIAIASGIFFLVGKRFKKKEDKE